MEETTVLAPTSGPRSPSKIGRARRALLSRLDPQSCPSAATELDARFRRLLWDAESHGLTLEETVRALATEMYRHALESGAGETDVGVYGPRLFSCDAFDFIEREARAARRCIDVQT